ncbi:MAG TPA: sulfotransferase [Bradyrhizobium sp.]|nr:sulfotransferase [Bradyrhizobium sp.]
MRTAIPDRQAVPTIDAARRAFANGDIAATESLCARILAKKPNQWAAWALLTETALQRGRADAAIVCAERAAALASTNPIPLILKAKCLFVSGKAREALAAAEAAETIVGDTPEALDALGGIFGMLALHERARSLFLRAVDKRPGVPQYLFNLAATERMTGALAQAEAHCDAALALDPTYSLAHYLRSDLRIQTTGSNHVAEMEAVIAEKKLPPANQVLLHFALAKEYEDLALHEHAFQHVDAGCALQRGLLGPTRADGTAEIDRIIASHTKSWIASAPEGHAAAAPVFVVGLPRTGTTLVDRIIASHPAMRSVGETGAFAAELARAAVAGGRRPDPASLGRSYLEAASLSRLPADARFVDKTLDNYLYCGLIHVALPRAKIILVQRRPMDACWAMYKAHFAGKFAFSYHQEELADHYLAYRRLATHWKATLPPHALLEVNYEDIVHDQEAESRRMIDFAGLAWDDEVLRFHDSKAPSATASAVQVRRPIYASSIGKWRHHAEGLAPLRARLSRVLPEQELS